MATMFKTLRRFVTGSVTTTHWFVVLMVAQLVAMMTAGTAMAQDFRSTEAIVRGRMAQADAKTAIAEVRALQAACARGDSKACGGRKTAEAKVAQLVGCAVFKGEAEQTFCLETIARISAETTQAGLTTVLQLNTGVFRLSKDRDGSEKWAELSAGNPVVGGGTAGSRPCFEYEGMSGGTAETPATMQRIRCKFATAPTEYDSRPIAPAPPAASTDASSGVEVWGWYLGWGLGGAAAGALTGAGIGGFAAPEDMDTESGRFSRSGAGLGALTGAGIGAVVGLVTSCVTRRWHK